MRAGISRRRDALAEQLARAAVARLGGERGADEVAGAGEADHRLRLAALALGVAPDLGEDVAGGGAGGVQALGGGRARGQRGGVLGDAGELDADRVVGLLADHAGAHEDVGDRAREAHVGGGGDEAGALGDHLARVGRAAEAGHAVHAEGLVEQRRRREPVRRDEALGHRDHRRARGQPGRLQVADDLREPARRHAEEDVVGAREPGRHRLHAQLAREVDLGQVGARSGARSRAARPARSSGSAAWCESRRGRAARPRRSRTSRRRGRRRGARRARGWSAGAAVASRDSTPRVGRVVTELRLRERAGVGHAGAGADAPLAALFLVGERLRRPARGSRATSSDTSDAICGLTDGVELAEWNASRLSRICSSTSSGPMSYFCSTGSALAWPRARPWRRRPWPGRRRTTPGRRRHRPADAGHEAGDVAVGGGDDRVADAALLGGVLERGQRRLDRHVGAEDADHRGAALGDVRQRAGDASGSRPRAPCPRRPRPRPAAARAAADCASCGLGLGRGELAAHDPRAHLLDLGVDGVLLRRSRSGSRGCRGSSSTGPCARAWPCGRRSWLPRPACSAPGVARAARVPLAERGGRPRPRPRRARGCGDGAATAGAAGGGSWLRRLVLSHTSGDHRMAPVAT